MSSALQGSFSVITAYLQSRRFIYDLGVFAALFLTAKFGVYIFYAFDTSPAVIWPPVGIALAAVLLRGYRMWFIIALAQCTASFTNPAAPPLLVIAVSTFAYTLQPLLSAYVLQRLGFHPAITRARDALALIGVAFLCTMIAPSLITLTQTLSGSLTAPAWIAWTRSWAGGVMSVIVLTPLLTSWFSPLAPHIVRKTILEKTLASLAIAGATYLVFWTTLPQFNVFVLLYVLFAPLFWIGLRMGPRIMTLAFFIITTLAVMGTILANPSGGEIGQQLFADELFILLIAPIFFILSTLVEERRSTLAALEKNIEDLQFALEKISVEDKAKNEFLATLAHELRNPLASVVTNLEVAKMQMEDIDRPEVLHHANVAISHVSTITKLLDDLLDTSRISRKEIVLRKENVELQALLRHACDTAQTHFTEKNQDLTLSMPAEAIWCTVDPLRLEQVVVNLLTNASKYSPEKAKVVLSVITDPERGIRISVKDNGLGIKPQMLNKIFDPFTQLHQTGKTSAGLGLGLSLSKRLVELHKGRIWAESDGPGRGSEFVVVLPFEKSMQPAVPLTSTYTSGTQKFHYSVKKALLGNKRTILMVDDNKATAYALQVLLERNGHRVMVVHDGPEALEEMRKHSFDLLLLDIGLPGMDGYTVAERVREQFSHLPLIIVALTGYGQESDKMRAREAGFDFHLTKPVSITQIEEVITTVDAHPQNTAPKAA